MTNPKDAKAFVITLIVFVLVVVVFGYMKTTNQGVNDLGEETISYSEDLKRLKDNFDFVLGSFPELESEKIEIAFGKGNRYLVAQPVFLSLLQKNTERRYRIIISRKESLGNFAENASDNTVRGGLAHELAHIISYQEMNNSKLALFGLKYVFNKEFRKQVEIETTEEAIRRGFIKELLEGAEALFNSPVVPESYKQNVREIYSTLEEFEEIFEEEK